MTTTSAPTTVEVVAPIDGTIINIVDVPDPAFSKKPLEMASASVRPLVVTY